jgi:hypothetical protein
MIQIDSLLYKIDQKINKLSTNEHQQIQLEDKILALNEAQIKLIKQKVDGVQLMEWEWILLKKIRRLTILSCPL